MRVISMQSKNVWDIIQRDKIYHANNNLCRENNDYSVDIEKLKGYQPIWCFAWPEINFYSIYDGEVLEYIRCEMSLQQRNCWDNFVMLELEIDKSELHTGYAHNGCGYSCIFKEITLDMVKAAYTLRDSEENGFYYKVITPIYVSCDDVITTKELDCRQAVYESEHSTEGMQYTNIGKCLVCSKDTHYGCKGKHFCSLGHKWRYEQRFKRLCRNFKIPEDSILKEYDMLTDADLTKGVVKAIQNIEQRITND